MNERIKELAEQANELDYETFDAYNHKTIQHYKFDKEKFAELIVRECLDIAKNWEDQLDNASCLKESNAVGIVAYRISRQFGVEE